MPPTSHTAEENWRLRATEFKPVLFQDDHVQSFYGYPTIAPVNEREYLVVFTERARMEGTEQADLYYFRLIFE